MHAVKNKMNAFAPFRCWVKVKNKAVQQVFGGGPYKKPNTKIESKTDNADAGVKCFEAKKENNRDINEQRNGKMHLRQCFHPIGLKHPD